MWCSWSHFDDSFTSRARWFFSSGSVQPRLLLDSSIHANFVQYFDRSFALSAIGNFIDWCWYSMGHRTSIKFYLHQVWIGIAMAMLTVLIFLYLLDYYWYFSSRENGTVEHVNKIKNVFGFILRQCGEIFFDWKWTCYVLMEFNFVISPA